MKIRLYFALAVIALLTIFAIQNIEVTRIRFLFWEWYISRALLTFVQLAAGFLAGWMVSGLVRMRPR